MKPSLYCDICGLICVSLFGVSLLLSHPQWWFIVGAIVLDVISTASRKAGE